MVAVAAVPAASSIPNMVPSAADVAAHSAAAKRRLDNPGGQIGGITCAAPKLAKVARIQMQSQGNRACVAPPLLAPQPIVTVCQTEGAKRPQMKYDPSVPMSKEDTSAWRREQRRKRNRESAAACRKRQRDRISELEGEVNEWKVKFDDALRKLGAMEGDGAAREMMQMLERTMPIAEPKAMVEVKEEEMCSSPRPPPPVEPPKRVTFAAQVDATSALSSHVISPHHDRRKMFVPPLVTSESLHFPLLEEVDPIQQFRSQIKTQIKTQLKANHIHPGGILAGSRSIKSRVENRQHLNEKITPAVKIAGAVNPPLDIESVCDDLLQVVPDSCLSLTEKKTMPFPETCPSLVPSSSAVASLMSVSEHPPHPPSAVTTDESGEDSDLGEFLLDAVTWL